MPSYQFQTELDALRIRLGAEASLDVKWVPVNHQSLIFLLSMFGKYLSTTAVKNKERRNMRLSMLSLWLNKRIKSSYDLTVYQCSTIIDFLEYKSGQEFTPRAKQFLDDSKETVEAGNLFSPFGDVAIENSSPFMP